MIRKLIASLFTKPKLLSEWYQVQFDSEKVTLSAQPPGRDSWQQFFAWSSIIRICFRGEGLGASDGIYVFTSERPESYVIPLEADGGDEFWQEILRRKLFDEELAIKAATTEVGTFCWPP